MMAERIVRQLIDDLDGSEIPDGKGESIEFAFRGVSYRIDLNNANVAKLERALAPYIGSAAKTGASRRRGRGRRNGRTDGSSKEGLSAIRTWAAKHGHTVSSRGRIPSKVVEAYQAAHSR
ncbi:MAG: Lsr2 family protein [Mycobacteriaceae bacterium]|nr:Lsr2 family protein [Mycobacteriaceae bacterium]